MTAEGAQARRRRARRWMAGVGGLGTVGTVAGVTAARSIARRAPIEDPYLGEDFGLFDSDRGCVVTTSDGVDLAVRSGLKGAGADDIAAYALARVLHAEVTPEGQQATLARGVGEVA